MNYFERFLAYRQHGVTPETATCQGSEPLRAESQCLRFFDTIPVDALSILVQYLALHPHRERWLASVNANDALTVLRLGGSLTIAARERFRTLDQSAFKHHRQSELDSLGTVMAPHLEHLYLRPIFWRTLNCDSLDVLRVLALNKFVELNAIEQIVTSCGANLRELRFCKVTLQQRTIRTIARYCYSLEVLDLGFATYPGTLGRIWRAIGNTLRELSGRIGEGELVHIATHCTSLELLDLSDSEDLMFSRLTIELLKALQALKVLKMKVDGGIQPNALNALLNVCPSDLRIRCHMGFRHSHECFDYLLVLCGRLRELCLTCLFSTFRHDAVPFLGNLERLSLHPGLYINASYVSTMETIFINPLPNLRYLRIGPLDGAKMLTALTSAISSLREFRCELAWQTDNTWKLQQVQVSDLADFLQANKHLECIKLKCFNNDQNGMDEVMIQATANLIRRLKNCAFLREVEITHEGTQISKDWLEIRNACVQLRTKRVNVTVNNIRFLPSLGTP